MRLLREVTNANSGWDAKGLYMGTSTLISMEEVNRDYEGVVPFHLRYDWTHGHWNDDYSEFQLTFTAKMVDDGGERQQKHFTLWPKDFGLI
jgi:hypothetical protein